MSAFRLFLGDLVILLAACNCAAPPGSGSSYVTALVLAAQVVPVGFTDPLDLDPATR